MTELRTSVGELENSMSKLEPYINGIEERAAIELQAVESELMKTKLELQLSKSVADMLLEHMGLTEEYQKLTNSGHPREKIEQALKEKLDAMPTVTIMLL